MPAFALNRPDDERREPLGPQLALKFADIAEPNCLGLRQKRTESLASEGSVQQG